jgi:hypothetical protein
VISYHLDGALHVGFVCYKGFAESVSLACGFQDLCIEE